jgi:hypothetical protein
MHLEAYKSCLKGNPLLIKKRAEHNGDCFGADHSDFTDDFGKGKIESN